MDQVDGEKDPLKQVTLNCISVTTNLLQTLLDNKSVPDFAKKAPSHHQIIRPNHKAQIAQELLQLPASQENHDYNHDSPVMLATARPPEASLSLYLIIIRLRLSLTKNEEYYCSFCCRLLPRIANAFPR